MAFFCLRPVFHPRVLPNDVAGAGEGRAVKGRFLGSVGGATGTVTPTCRVGTYLGFSPQRSEERPHMRYRFPFCSFRAFLHLMWLMNLRSCPACTSSEPVEQGRGG